MRAERDIAIAGAGYVGLTSAVCFCELGHRVRLVEVNPHRLAAIEAGQCPIYEEGLPELLNRHLGRRLTVTNRLTDAVVGAQALFVCVGTPPRSGGSPDLRALKHLLTDLRAIPDLCGTRVVLKSTVPPGTNRLAYEWLDQRVPVVSNPEFLREGTAIHDFFHPDRIVVGSPDAGAALAVAGLYHGIDAPLLVTGWEEAELVKWDTWLYARKGPPPTAVALTTCGMGLLEVTPHTPEGFHVRHWSVVALYLPRPLWRPSSFRGSTRG